jgi:predicted metal-binding membrane protein
MTPAARERARVRTPMLWISAAAWTLLLIHQAGQPGHHHTPESLLTTWSLMLAAMMLPLLIAPVRHVRGTTFARRRARSIALFLSGYAVVWIAAGSLMLLTLALTRNAPSWVIIAALVWQCSPFKQYCLNRGHIHPSLNAFSPAADFDALSFGLSHGGWCVASCWGLMLLPLLVSPAWHWAAMALVSIWLYAERLERPTPPCWTVPIPSKAARLAVAQARLRL